MHARIVPHLFAKHARCITHVQTYTHTCIHTQTCLVCTQTHCVCICVFVYLCTCIPCTCQARRLSTRRPIFVQNLQGGYSLQISRPCVFVCVYMCVCVTMQPTVRGFVLQNNAADIARFRARFCTCLHACMLCYPLTVSMGVSNNNLVHMTT
jgi:hypothetical protein